MKGIEYKCNNCGFYHSFYAADNYPRNGKVYCSKCNQEVQIKIHKIAERFSSVAYMDNNKNMDEEKYVIINYGDYDQNKKCFKDKPYYVEFMGDYMGEPSPFFTPNINEALVFYSWKYAENFINENLDGTYKICLYDE